MSLAEFGVLFEFLPTSEMRLVVDASVGGLSLEVLREGEKWEGLSVQSGDNSHPYEDYLA